MKLRMAVVVPLLAIAVGGVAGWFRPFQAPVGATGGGAGAWSLPATAQLERSSAAQYAAIRAVPWVGTGTGPVGATTSEWTLLGLVGRPDDRAVLVQAGKDPLIKRLGAGDTLPDGSRLISVGSDGIVVDRNGCRVRRPLYAAAQESGEAPAEPQCLPPGNE
ncbi:MAG: hypothetical protein ACTHOC_02125 [Luteimonas sp.]